MRSSLLLAFVFALTACGSAPYSDDPGNPKEGPPDTTGTESQGPGWTILDRAPYARVGHSAVLDEEGDRMIVFGGGANDTWELPLSGPHANEWSQLVVAGEHPPAHPYGSSLFADSAVYDPAGKRMIVLLDPLPSTADENDDVQLWELSLSGAPKWRRLVTLGPDPGAEAQSGHLALDRKGNRLFVAGGALHKTGVWALSLDGTPAWTRLADTPPGDLGPFYAEASLLFDAERDELVLFGGHPRLGKIRALSLATGKWELLDDGNQASWSYGATSVLDAEHDRIVIFGGDESHRVYLFSLETHTWASADAGEPDALHLGASGAVDAQRGRVLYFSGVDGEEMVNTTWAFSLDDLALSELVPATRRADSAMGERALAWDPARGAVIAFGGHQSGETWMHGLTGTDTWAPVAAGTTPSIALMPAVYDPAGKAVVAFGGTKYQESKAVVRLASSPGAEWETVSVADGPAARARHVAIYDEANGRMVIHGGWQDNSVTPWKLLGDTWALSLGDAPGWTELAPAGAKPAERFGHAAIYDPEKHRMITFGGIDAQGKPFTDVWSLSLDGAPEWTLLAPTGTSPGAALRPSAVYDPKGRRMVVVDFTPELSPGAARVLALDLDGPPAWHRFCSPGITPAESWDFPGSAPNAVLVEGALFVTLNGGAFRFDLSTSYCD